MQSTLVPVNPPAYGDYLMKEFALWNFINPIFTFVMEFAIEF